jgi:hypothetical protein
LLEISIDKNIETFYIDFWPLCPQNTILRLHTLRE